MEPNRKHIENIDDDALSLEGPAAASDAQSSAPADTPALSISQRAMKQTAVPYLEGLNAEQRAAVEALEGPVLVLAGAGTGKTRVLTTRIAHILATRQAWPREILAVTFTNRAAREMKERIGTLIGGAVEGMPWLGTFHSIGVKILRRHAELVDLKSGFTILDTDDQIRLLKQLMAAENIDPKRWPARQLANMIDGWKNKALTPDKVPQGDAMAFAEGRGAKLYKAYQARLKELNAADFGDLLLECLRLFQTHPDILKDYHARFKFILVDEYQDTNVAQYLWLRLLAQGSHNVCCVGDDDQSIYGWRGAEVDNILRFDTDFPGAQVFRVEQNYRSTGHILEAAGGLIAKNEGRLGKSLHTDIGDGEKVVVTGVWDDEEEARQAVEQIEQLQKKAATKASALHKSLDGLISTIGPSDARSDIEKRIRCIRTASDKELLFDLFASDLRSASTEEKQRSFDQLEKISGLNEVAILVRASFQMRAFEDRFVTTGLPYRVIGGPKFYERAEIRDATAFLEITVNPSNDLKFERIVNVPKRGLGDVTIKKVHAHGRARGIPLYFAAKEIVETEELGPKPLRALAGVVANFERWRGLIDEIPHTELAEMILDESGYTEMWQKDKSPQAHTRLENLKELVRFMEQFENMAGFLEHVSLVMDAESNADGDRVSLMTLHAAKGLEFDTVFLPGWEEGLFPHQRSLDESGTAGLEEERRLAYVGVTRAKRRARISFAQNRRVHGLWQTAIPSRFVDELPEANVDVEEDSGNYGGYGAAPGASRFDRMSGGSFGGGNDGGSSAGGFANSYDTPGWQRAQKNWSRPNASKPSRSPRTIDGELVATSTGHSSRYTVGDRVRHNKFGEGLVSTVDGNKLVVEFDTAGSKKVVDSFIEKA